MLAALEETESDGDKLLDAARRLAGAFSELLTAAQPGSAEVDHVNLLKSFEASHNKNIFISLVSCLPHLFSFSNINS